MIAFRRVIWMVILRAPPVGWANTQLAHGDLLTVWRQLRVRNG